jgi:hypothetical protein
MTVIDGSNRIAREVSVASPRPGGIMKSNESPVARLVSRTGWKSWDLFNGAFTTIWLPSAVLSTLFEPGKPQLLSTMGTCPMSEPVSDSSSMIDAGVLLE